MEPPDILYVPYVDTLDLLTVDDAMRICEDVFRMHARDTVAWSSPPSFKLDAPTPFHNHWNVKGVLLKEIPITGVRLVNYFDDGASNTVGTLGRLGQVVLADPNTGHALAIVDEHWSFAIRSAAAAILACKWLGPAKPRVLGLIGIGNMGTNALRCLTKLYKFEEIRCTSRRIETRETFANEWSEKLGIKVRPCSTLEDVATDADLVVGGTTSSAIMCREHWLKPGCTFISLARRELDPDGWAKMDKIVIDNWDINITMPVFKAMVEAGQFSKAAMYAEIHEVVAGKKPGRTGLHERILIHTTGIASQDVALAHHLFVAAKQKGKGVWLPAARSERHEPSSLRR